MTTLGTFGVGAGETCINSKSIYFFSETFHMIHTNGSVALRLTSAPSWQPEKCTWRVQENGEGQCVAETTPLHAASVVKWLEYETRIVKTWVQTPAQPCSSVDDPGPVILSQPHLPHRAIVRPKGEGGTLWATLSSLEEKQHMNAIKNFKTGARL